MCSCFPSLSMTTTTRVISPERILRGCRGCIAPLEVEISDSFFRVSAMLGKEEGAVDASLRPSRAVFVTSQSLVRRTFSMRCSMRRMLTKTAASGQTFALALAVVVCHMCSYCGQRGGVSAYPATRCPEEVLNNWPLASARWASASMIKMKCNMLSLFRAHTGVPPMVYAIWVLVIYIICCSWLVQRQRLGGYMRWRGPGQLRTAAPVPELLQHGGKSLQLQRPGAQVALRVVEQS